MWKDVWNFIKTLCDQGWGNSWHCPKVASSWFFLKNPTRQWPGRNWAYDFTILKRDPMLHHVTPSTHLARPCVNDLHLPKGEGIVCSKNHSVLSNNLESRWCVLKTNKRKKTSTNSLRAASSWTSESVQIFPRNSLGGMSQSVAQRSGRTWKI